MVYCIKMKIPCHLKAYIYYSFLMHTASLEIIITTLYSGT